LGSRVQTSTASNGSRYRAACSGRATTQIGRSSRARSRERSTMARCWGWSRSSSKTIPAPPQTSDTLHRPGAGTVLRRGHGIRARGDLNPRGRTCRTAHSPRATRRAEPPGEGTVHGASS
jgi:hypothetical protein